MDTGTGSVMLKASPQLVCCSSNQHLDISTHSFYSYIQKHTCFLMTNIAFFSPTSLILEKINSMLSVCTVCMVQVYESNMGEK